MMYSTLPLLLSHNDSEFIAWRQGRPVNRETFLTHVTRVAEHLPSKSFVINLCEDRYCFMVAFAATITRGQTNLLPANRLEREVGSVEQDYPSGHRLTDAVLENWIADGSIRTMRDVPSIPSAHLAAIAFTSGSTGRPRPNLKTWGNLVHGAYLAQRRFGFGNQQPKGTLVATVPPQHMYGLETSVLVPLVTGVGIDSGRPFFPEDIRTALARVPVPRVLITSPAHLRVCVEMGGEWPEVAFIVSATAPLSTSLAQRAENTLDTRIFEIYGCTEAGSLASRRTVERESWRLYDGLEINQGSEGCYVYGPHLPEPVMLNDILELQGTTRFRLLGRREDMLNIAGKRASLADLNLKLNEIEGVEDGVFMVFDENGDRTRRLAALVVAPGLNERQIVATLAQRIDPAFLPRPLYKVAYLPRNETGKLPRNALYELFMQMRERSGREYR